METKLPENVEYFLEGMYGRKPKKQVRFRHKLLFAIFCLPCFAIFNDAPEGHELNMWINLFGLAWLLLVVAVAFIIYGDEK